ncbi:MAG: GNAT family N-acetyltransferase [Spirochaetes bacterium]|jgi:GNAT superfamily N-acetyltransferase|nr:GNAT family N-acetyltransferase [Spirochaetota bacterium]
MNEEKPRILKEDELQKLLDLYEHLHPGDGNIATDRTRSSWESIMKNRDIITVFVIELEGIMASSCVLSVIPNLTRGGRPYGLLENMITHPAYRNRGLGKAVVTEAIRHARNRNCYKVMLLSDSKRTEAHAFYEAVGFDRGKKIGFVFSL